MINQWATFISLPDGLWWAIFFAQLMFFALGFTAGYFWDKRD